MIINKRWPHFHNCKVLFLFVSSTLSEHPGVCKALAVMNQQVNIFESTCCTLDPYLQRIQKNDTCKQAGLSKIYICGKETSMIINKAGLFPTLVKLFSCIFALLLLKDPDVCKALAFMIQQVHMVKCTCMYPSSTLHL